MNAEPGPALTDDGSTTTRAANLAPASGLAAAFGVIALSMLVPWLLDWQVSVSFPPLHSSWDPRVGVGTVPAVLIALIGTRYAFDVAARLRWRSLLVVVFGTGLAWMLALAYVDGSDGIGVILGTQNEYLPTARATDDLPYALSTYTERIPRDAPLGNLDEHLAGHPPGALTFFVLLVRLGLGGTYAAGMVVTLIAATTAVAVLITLRTLGAETLARRAAPFLVLGPVAIWMCVSGDGVFAAVAAWGLTALALAATRTKLAAGLAWSVLAGLILGFTVMLSYGFPLFGFLALAVLVIARNWRPLVPAALAACVVVGIYAGYGFYWWEAIGVLRDRYYDGIASRRPAEYWGWANLASLAISAGPLLGAGIAHAAVRARRGALQVEERVVLWLVAGATSIILVADLSFMSKAEVERIWIPFVPWLLLSAVLLPERWRRRGLALQVLAALVTQHLTRSIW